MGDPPRCAGRASVDSLGEPDVEVHPSDSARTCGGVRHSAVRRNGHYPDAFGKVEEGIVYAKPTKLAEHGGMNPGDRHVLMVVDGPGIPAPVESAPVETTQVAPTILTSSRQHHMGGRSG